MPRRCPSSRRTRPPWPPALPMPGSSRAPRHTANTRDPILAASPAPTQGGIRHRARWRSSPRRLPMFWAAADHRAGAALLRREQLLDPLDHRPRRRIDARRPAFARPRRSSRRDVGLHPRRLGAEFRVLHGGVEGAPDAARPCSRGRPGGAANGRAMAPGPTMSSSSWRSSGLLDEIDHRRHARKVRALLQRGEQRAR